MCDWVRWPKMREGWGTDGEWKTAGAPKFSQLAPRKDMKIPVTSRTKRKFGVIKDSYLLKLVVVGSVHCCFKYLKSFKPCASMAMLLEFLCKCEGQISFRIREEMGTIPGVPPFSLWKTHNLGVALAICDRSESPAVLLRTCISRWRLCCGRFGTRSQFSWNATWIFRRRFLNRGINTMHKRNSMWCIAVMYHTIIWWYNMKYHVIWHLLYYMI